MPMNNIEKHRAVIRLSDGSYHLMRWIYRGASSEPTIPPAPSAGFVAVEVSDIDLNGLSYKDFMQQKKPVIIAGEFDSWTDRDSPPNLSVSTNPKADMSNTPSLNITGGTANDVLTVQFSRPVDHELSGDTLTLDSNGEGSFKFRVFGRGYLSVKTYSMASPEVSLDITVDSGTFA